MLLNDTNILSFLWRGDSRWRHYYRRFMSHHPALAISQVTVDEMIEGAVAADWTDEEIGGLEEFLSTFEVVP